MTRNPDGLPRIFGALPLVCVCTLPPANALEQPRQAAIASPNPLAGAAGREVMVAGGNAFDAAIAISATLAVVEPYSTSLGGGGFFLLRQHGDPAQYQFLDAREKAPLKASPKMFRRRGVVQPDLSLNGPLASGVPGLPAALVELAEHYGKLPLSITLAPAIRLAYQGFPVDHIYRERAHWRLFALRNDPESARLFLRDNNVPELGELIQQPELARTLDRMACRGWSGFYGGLTGQALVNGVRSAGGVWGYADLEGYEVIPRQPLRMALDQQRELISAPPPSIGGVVLAQSLGMLQRIPWRDADHVGRAHLVAEVLRRAYRDRNELGDPGSISNPLRALLAPAYLAQQAAGIDQRHAMPGRNPPAAYWHEGDQAAHFAVLDTEGNAVAGTLSVNLPFGAAFTVPGTGLLLNNVMNNFAADSQGSATTNRHNLIEPGKRPLSNMSPSFIEGPHDLAAFGTGGGSRVPGTVLLAMLQYLDGEPITHWAAAPRFHPSYMPDVLKFEPGAFTEDEQRELQTIGHALKQTNRAYGNQQVLLWQKDSSHVEAASDPRGLGVSETFDPKQPRR